MTVREIFSKVRDRVQDTDSIYWDDSELLDTYNECKRYLASERKESPITIEIPLFSNINTYSVDGVLRYISCKDSDGKVRELYPDNGDGDDISSAVIVQDYNSLYVNTPVSNTSLIIKCIQYPIEDNLNDIVRSGDEESYTYFILSKCFEKDNDMEQFQKAQYFWSMFIGAMKNSKKNSSLNYMEKIQTTKAYFY